MSSTKPTAASVVQEIAKAKKIPATDSVCIEEEITRPARLK